MTTKKAPNDKTSDKIILINTPYIDTETYDEFDFIDLLEGVENICVYLLVIKNELKKNLDKKFIRIIGDVVKSLN